MASSKILTPKVKINFFKLAPKFSNSLQKDATLMKNFPPTISLKTLLHRLFFPSLPNFKKLFVSFLNFFSYNSSISYTSMEEQLQETLESKTSDLAKSEEIPVVDENPVIKSIEIDNPVPDFDNPEVIICGSSSKTLDSDEILVKEKNPCSKNQVFGVSGEELGGRECQTLEFDAILGDGEGSVIKDVKFDDIPLKGSDEIAGLMIEEEVAKFGKTLESERNPDIVESENLINFGEDNIGVKIDDALVVKTLEETTQLVKKVSLINQQGANIVEDVKADKSETSEECDDKEGELKTSVIVSKSEEASGVMGDKDDDDDKSDDEIDVEELMGDEIRCSDSTEKGPFDGNVDGICEEDLLGNEIMPRDEEGTQFDSNVGPLSKRCVNFCNCYKCHERNLSIGFGGPLAGHFRKPCGCRWCCNDEFEIDGNDDSNDDGELFDRSMAMAGMRNPYEHHRFYPEHDYPPHLHFMRSPFGRPGQFPMRHSEKCERKHRMRMIRDHHYRMFYRYNRAQCCCNEDEAEWTGDHDRRWATRRPGFDNREPGWGYLPSIVPEPEPCPVGAGLANLGNTCFVNSIMQCFTHTVPFVEGILSLKHDSSSHGKDEFCVLCAVRDQIEQSLANSGKVITPSNIVDNLNHISLDFQRYQQQDAQELLACLFDKLDSNWCKYESNSENLLSSPDSLVQQLFGGRLVSQIGCCSCGHKSDTYDPVIDLSLEIDDVDNVESALKSFTKVENLEGTDKVKCNGCKELVEAEKRLLLDQSPPIVVLHLKRFKSDGIRVEKIDRTVKYPLELDLEPFSSGAVHNNEDLKYELIGIVVHVGIFSNYGHYFCYIHASPDAWYRFDDSKVAKVSEAHALDQDAYILFYAKKGTPWFSSVLDNWKSRLEEKMSSSPKSVLESRERPSTSSWIEASLNGSDDAVKADAISDTTCSEPSVDVRHNMVETEVGAAAQERFFDRSTSISSAPVQRDLSADKVGVGSLVSGRANNLFSEPSSCLNNADQNAGAEDCKREPLGTSPSMKTCSTSNVENHHDEPKFDVEINPPISPAPGSPGIYTDEEPAEVPFKIPSQHLKIQEKAASSSVKQSVCKAKTDLKQREAIKLIGKTMPSSRGHQFMAAIMKANRSDNSSSKKRKKLSNAVTRRYSPKKRAKISPKRILPMHA